MCTGSMEISDNYFTSINIPFQRRRAPLCSALTCPHLRNKTTGLATFDTAHLNKIYPPYFYGYIILPEVVPGALT